MVDVVADAYAGRYVVERAAPRLAGGRALFRQLGDDLGLAWIERDAWVLQSLDRLPRGGGRAAAIRGAAHARAAGDDLLASRLATESAGRCRIRPGARRRCPTRGADDARGGEGRRRPRRRPTAPGPTARHAREARRRTHPRVRGQRRDPRRRVAHRGRGRRSADLVRRAPGRRRSRPRSTSSATASASSRASAPPATTRTTALKLADVLICRGELRGGRAPVCRRAREARRGRPRGRDLAQRAARGFSPHGEVRTPRASVSHDVRSSRVDDRLLRATRPPRTSGSRAPSGSSASRTRHARRLRRRSRSTRERAIVRRPRGSASCSTRSAAERRPRPR